MIAFGNIWHDVVNRVAAPDISMDNRYDLIVVGGGVLGTFYAYHALQKGLKTALIEKDSTPISATVRNFGQVVPSGMNARWQRFGRQSLEIYKNIQQQADISVRQNGSVYIASNDEELQLLEELAVLNKRNAYTSSLLTKEQCLAKYPGLRNNYAVGGLFFPEEVTVEPRKMIGALHHFLKEQHSLDIRYNTPVVAVDEITNGVSVTSTSGSTFTGDKVIICNGSEFKLLFPDLFVQSGIEVTKLQMMQTKVQHGYYLPGSILTGWSIRRYEAFYECPSFSSIKAREDKSSLQHTWGVHILFKQADDGSVIIGDSHEYTTAAHVERLGFDIDEDINDFMITEARKIIDLPDYTIQRKWIGVYAQCKDSELYHHDVNDRIHIVTAIGGKGMTGSAGFTEQHLATLLNK